ncbi:MULTISPECIES: VOC family protein [Actinoplanes]|uniref:VOC family protein n=1 Tax=Actinoplanes TaxID=1865 RepID=UPI000695CF04|nr:MULTISPECIES: VOC family protein [Actinoplanes]GLY03195.1 hypothetical protein Acsp01_35740 [Actinoplanes sp. NBRC 101535]
MIASHGDNAALNPLVIVDDAAGLIRFVTAVFDVAEVPEARTPMPDGKLIHSEIRIGTATLVITDRLKGWPARPALLQVWVHDVTETLDRASARGATVITPATPFYGECTLGRMLDPWQNIWWLYAAAPGQPDPLPHWEGGSDIVFTSLDEALRSLAEN